MEYFPERREEAWASGLRQYHLPTRCTQHSENRLTREFSCMAAFMEPWTPRGILGRHVSCGDSLGGGPLRKAGPAATAPKPP